MAEQGVEKMARLRQALDAVTVAEEAIRQARAALTVTDDEVDCERLNWLRKQQHLVGCELRQIIMVRAGQWPSPSELTVTGQAKTG